MYVTLANELKRIKPSLTPSDKAIVASKLKLSRITLYRYLNGKVGHKEIAERILEAFKERIGENEK